MENIKEKLKNNRKRIIVGATSFIGTLLVVYLGMALYFINHYYFGSEINGISVSGKSVKKVEELMEGELQAYALNLKERGDKNEQIKAADIGLKYNPEGEFKNLKDRQNPFKWISSLFNTEASKITVGVSYDRNLLNERMYKLACFDSSNITEPKNPGFKYENNGYVIIDEVNGNKVNEAVLYYHVEDAIFKRQTTIDLEAIDCYYKPQYTSKSQKIIDTKDILNKYAAAKITYTFGESKEVVDGSIISTWLTVDENFKVIFDEGKVKEYIDALANKYNTLGKTRNFVTSSGKTINIKRGDYGWSINRAKETKALSSAIKEGQTITKEPAYTQTALSRSNIDIGNTYVEIDMAKQYLWYYKNGSLIAQGPVVTGNVSAGHTTPEGIYRLKYKARNVVLRGPDYAAPVTFWMPFNGGIGIHDASWRSRFGGNIYRTNGSHGCINSPYNLAKTIYENIQPGTPVICHNNR